MKILKIKYHILRVIKLDNLNQIGKRKWFKIIKLKKNIRLYPIYSRFIKTDSKKKDFWGYDK